MLLNLNFDKDDLQRVLRISRFLSSNERTVYEKPSSFANNWMLFSCLVLVSSIHIFHKSSFTRSICDV